MTTPHKAILVATDLTARCDRPIDRALMLAEEWNVKLYIVHVMDVKDVEGLGIKSRDVEDNIRAQLSPHKAEVEVMVKTGRVADAIIETAKREKCGLIVTGVARYDSVEDFFLGNPVDQLVQYSNIPVLIVKQKPMQHYKNIVIATDFSECALATLNVTAELFPGPALHLIHAYHEPYETWLKSESVKADVKSEEQAMMDRFLAKRAIDDSTFDRMNASIEKGDLAAILLEKVIQTDAGLVALGTHGRSGFAAASIGSKAKVLLDILPQDVLMVRGRN